MHVKFWRRPGVEFVTFLALKICRLALRVREAAGPLSVCLSSLAISPRFLFLTTPLLRVQTIYLKDSVCLNCIIDSVVKIIGVCKCD